MVQRGLGAAGVHCRTLRYANAFESKPLGELIDELESNKITRSVPREHIKPRLSCTFPSHRIGDIEGQIGM
ncbi:hypothetical protein EVAR_88014_1 [Eumeta japonica]|uniref:Uncharacterized protein n=1 Tax=Eumeta variegata TaxID=151549 RepID=A0A4C1VEQ4_EUMVA|nr:hypothetical protein EVAR_88014_1 [Eumeta japonica]